MEMYEIFRSEGGYRVCGQLHIEQPVIEASPWFKTKTAAVKAAEKMKKVAEEIRRQNELLGQPSPKELKTLRRF